MKQPLIDGGVCAGVDDGGVCVAPALGGAGPGEGVFSLGLGAGRGKGFLGKLWAAAGEMSERVLALSRLNEIYARVSEVGERSAFVRRVLAELRVSYEACEADLARVPKKGPVVVVANHPFGAIEGLVLADLLGRVRADVKIMANYVLGRIPQLRELFVLVDPFGGAGSARGNVGAMRQCVKHLSGGGLLAVFPAGEVSSLDLRRREVTDRAWSPMVGRMVRRTGASAVPVFFNGRNGAAFQIAGLVHPKLRTALLARQVMNKAGRSIDVRIGGVIAGRKLKGMSGEGEVTAYLRRRTYALKHRGCGEFAGQSSGEGGGGSSARVMRPVVSIGDVGAMSAEVEGLVAAGRRLVEQEENVVVLATAEAAPGLMREVGRLREITFRAAGEGTGKSIDLDQFDSHYGHLVVWNRARRDVVGSYRMGRTDEILKERGVAGLYTYELFDYGREMLERMGPALEMGRSFVRAEYQRSFTPLLLLWKGIGRFLVENPRYRYLLGPVSISGAYQSASVRLMIQFLEMHHGDRSGAAQVSARTPFVAGGAGWRGGEAAELSSLARDEEELSALVADLEGDQKGLPVLIRQYLKLGAKFLSFNVDRSFGDCVDGLIWVDLLKTDRKVLERYLGKEGLAGYWGWWGVGGKVEG